VLNRQRSVQASLQVARKIQQGFMPSRMPPISGYEAATWWMANEAVGGDYCDVIPLNNQHVALAIADVSGHGVGPSLIMATVRAALHALRRQDPKMLVLATPVAPPSTLREFTKEADDIICLNAPEYFGAIGVFYRDFSQLSDEDVLRILSSVRLDEPDGPTE